MSEEPNRVAQAQAYIKELLASVPNISYHAKAMGSTGVTLAKIRDGKQERISEKVFTQIETYYKNFDFENPPKVGRGRKSKEAAKVVKKSTDKPIVSDETIRCLNADIERAKAQLKVLEDFKKSLGL